MFFKIIGSMLLLFAIALFVTGSDFVVAILFGFMGIGCFLLGGKKAEQPPTSSAKKAPRPAPPKTPSTTYTARCTTSGPVAGSRAASSRGAAASAGGSSYSSGDSDPGYPRYSAGDLVDLGGGQHFDRHHPEELLNRSCWVQDNQGGYYNYATRETVTYNNGTYSYHDAPSRDDPDDSSDSDSSSDDGSINLFGFNFSANVSDDDDNDDDDSSGGWSLF